VKIGERGRLIEQKETKISVDGEGWGIVIARLGKKTPVDEVFK
jgi:hypothetical protein